MSYHVVWTQAYQNPDPEAPHCGRQLWWNIAVASDCGGEWNCRAVELRQPDSDCMLNRSGKDGCGCQTRAPKVSVPSASSALRRYMYQWQ